MHDITLQLLPFQLFSSRNMSVTVLLVNEALAEVSNHLISHQFVRPSSILGCLRSLPTRRILLVTTTSLTMTHSPE